MLQTRHAVAAIFGVALVAGVRVDDVDSDEVLAVDSVDVVRAQMRMENVHLFFVTDCTAHQRWMAFNFLNSARLAGQDSPITWVSSGCAGEKSGSGDLASSLYPQAKLLDVLKGAEHEQKFNLAGGVPRAVQHFFDQQSIANDTVVALVEADMTFLSPLRVDDLDKRGLPSKGHKLIREGGSLLQGDLGVAARYLCCDDLGPPYILSGQAWRKLVPKWNELFQTGGWGADQMAFATAAQKVGLRFNRFDHFMVSALSTTPEGWTLVDNALKKSGNDVCANGEFQEGGSQLPTFLHVVQPWTTEKESSLGAWGFSKYQVPPGWGRATTTDGILECGMPLFAEPPTSLLQSASLLQSDSQEETRTGWVLCTILHSLNSMLVNYKHNRCPEGFNNAKALKMKVPLEWTNTLLEGADAAAPSGTNITWMERCVQGPDC